MESENATIFNISGGQINIAKDNSTINATQNNGVQMAELDRLINSIKADLKCLPKEEAEEVEDMVEDVNKELKKATPKPAKLRNCLKVIPPIIAVANGTPTLVNNLQKLIEMIQQYTK